MTEIAEISAFSLQFWVTYEWEYLEEERYQTCHMKASKQICIDKVYLISPITGGLIDVTELMLSEYLGPTFIELVEKEL